MGGGSCWLLGGECRQKSASGDDCSGHCYFLLYPAIDRNSAPNEPKTHQCTWFQPEHQKALHQLAYMFSKSSPVNAAEKRKGEAG